MTLASCEMNYEVVVNLCIHETYIKKEDKCCNDFDLTTEQQKNGEVLDGGVAE